MGYKDSIRRAAEAGRRAAVPFVRPTTVTVVVDQYDAPVGLDGSIMTSSTSTVVEPAPKVSSDGDGGASAFGGGFASTSAGGLVATEYTIGPITLKHSTGGYDVDDLLPAGGVERDVYVILAGGAFEGTGERFEVVPGSVDASRAHQFTFRVRRATQD